MKFVFVILHYCAVETTIQAVDTLLKCIQFDDYEIIIVDNASPDKSGDLLEERYRDVASVHILLNSLNEGFARGNNVGYRFARENLKADFIICMNNDVMILQEDFLQRISEMYERERFHVLGPDIVTPEGEHQNPHRQRPFELKEVTRIIRNRTVILWYLSIKRILHLQDKVRLIECWDERRGKAEKKGMRSDSPLENVVLHGSCMIFSPIYLEWEEEAFYPESFMWMEEEILTYLCQKKKYRILYSPQIWVRHLEGVSTKSLKKRSEKYEFYSRQLKNSAKVLKNLMTGK